MDWSYTKEGWEKHSAPCDGLESARNTETSQAQTYMAQKHTEGPEHDLVRSQKKGSGSTEMESNCGRPISPMGQRELDDNDFPRALRPDTSLRRVVTSQDTAKAWQKVGKREPRLV